jgi:Phosphotransferase enzyme family
MLRRLRETGYPIPRYVATGRLGGGTYVVQEALPGTPLRRVPTRLLPRILALNDLQRGRWVSNGPRWPAPIVDDTLRGGDGYCLLDPMRAYSPATARLLRVLQQIVATHADGPVTTDDVVHFDFNPSNLLAAGNQISGVIDWEGACAGDRAFDLATLLFYSYDVRPIRDALREWVVNLSGPTALALYLAHLTHRQVDWSIRHHGSAEVERWLRVATAILHALDTETG